VPPRLGALEGELLAQVRAQPDQSLEQLRQWAQARGVGVSATTIWKSLARLGLTLKKRPSTRKSASVPM
jgi:transposase